MTAVSTLPLVETSEASQPASDAQLVGFPAAPGHLLRLMPAGVTLRSRPGEVILDTVRRCGYAHRFGCRRGGCGVCRIDLLVGETIDAALISDSVLSLGDRHAGVRLSCRAVPTTDVVLRVRTDDELRCVSSFLIRYSDEKGSHPCP